MSIQNATADADDKLDPSEVPVVEPVGIVSGPMTDGETLIAFNDEDGNSVGVRLDDANLRELRDKIQTLSHLEELSEDE